MRLSKCPFKPSSSWKQPTCALALNCHFLVSWYFQGCTRGTTTLLESKEIHTKEIAPYSKETSYLLHIVLLSVSGICICCLSSIITIFNQIQFSSCILSRNFLQIFNLQFDFELRNILDQSPCSVKVKAPSTQSMHQEYSARVHPRNLKTLINIFTGN